MLRRWLISIPLLAALAALLGARLVDRAWLATLLAAAAGGLLAWVSLRAFERRVERLGERVTGFARGDTAPPVDADGPEWRPLSAALEEVGRSMAFQLDELAAERARIARLLEGLPPAILLFADGQLAYANAAARALFALNRGQARTPLQVLGVQALADAVEETRSTGRTVELEVERDDRALMARAAVTAADEVALVVTDLTEARRVDAIRRDFVINASHELKTPAAGIQALAESLGLAFERDPERAKRMIDRMQREAARLAQLVRDLLDLARLEEAAAERGRVRVDLCDVVRSQVERLAPLAASRHISVRADLPDNATLLAVPEDLRLIVGNLLENAVRYNRDGGRVDVRVRRHDREVVLEIADTGIGIPEADRDRVFERFYRVDKGRSRAAGGTGLGLSLVRHATQRHGGDVAVMSVLGEGSTFRVTLPTVGAHER